MINFREKFLEGLTETACTLMNKIALGESLTTNELVFLKTYMTQLDKYESVPIHQKVIDGIEKVSKFVKEIFPNIATDVDDYVIDTSEE